MKLPSLWSGNERLISDPFRSFRREMEDMFRAFDRNVPPLNVGAGVPAINVAETSTMKTSERSCDPEGCDVEGRSAPADMLSIPLTGQSRLRDATAAYDSKTGRLDRIGLGGKS